MSRHIKLLWEWSGSVPVLIYIEWQLIKTRILLLHIFIRGLILNYIVEIGYILKFSTSNTNLLITSNEVSNILE